MNIRKLLKKNFICTCSSTFVHVKAAQSVFLFKLSEMGEKRQQTKSLNAGNQLYYSHSDTQNPKLLLLRKKKH